MTCTEGKDKLIMSELHLAAFTSPVILSCPAGDHSPLPQVVPDGRLIQPLALVEELSDVVTGVFQQGAVHQKADAL